MCAIDVHGYFNIHYLQTLITLEKKTMVFDGHRLDTDPTNTYTKCQPASILFFTKYTLSEIIIPKITVNLNPTITSAKPAPMGDGSGEFFNLIVSSLLSFHYHLFWGNASL